MRVRLYELIAREGTLTSTEASVLTGESTASCSFHLRQLAKYGYIEDVPRHGGRERRWRRTSAANVFSRDAADAQYISAERLAAAVAVEHQLAHLRDFLDDIGHQELIWQEAAFLSDTLLYLEVDELAALKRDFLALTARYLERTTDLDRRPKGAQPVAVFATGFPLAPTPSGN